jgi:hypothetical protein
MLRPWVLGLRFRLAPLRPATLADGTRLLAELDAPTRQSAA